METSFRAAEPSDADALVEMMRGLYEHDRSPFDEPSARAALAQLLADDSLGAARLILLGGETAGYFVVTFGFSLEFGGRFVLLDELYLAPAIRGRGWGQRSLAFAESWTRAQGVAALRLELNHANTRARALYVKSGFTSDRRDLFTRRI